MLADKKQDPGGGPWHAVVFGDLIFTLYEKDSTLAARRISPLESTKISPIISVASIVPKIPPCRNFTQTYL